MILVPQLVKMNLVVFRVYTNKLYACFTAHNSKSSVTVDEDNILKNLNEKVYVVHDHYKHNYNHKYKFKNENSIKMFANIMFYTETCNRYSIMIN